MNAWRLEWLRLVRTRRWLVLLGPFTFFGLAGPVTVYYLPQLLASRLAEMKITLPPPAPHDGVIEYAETLSGIGLIVVIAVAAGALCLDANPTLATFYRTRVQNRRSLLLPRYVMTAAAAMVSFVIGTLAAWYESVVFLGPIPASRVIAAAGLGALYLAFTVGVVAVVASVVRSTLATVGLSLCALFALPVVGIYEPLGRWLPSALSGGVAAVLSAEAVTTYLGPAALTLALVPLMLAVAIQRLDRREV